MCAFGENMVGFTRLFTFLILCLLLWASPANAGRFLTVIITDVTDGDSLRAGKLRLRLFGIDAPEIQQKCQDATSKTYACGVRAKIRMQELAPIGATLICEHLDTDRYKRLIVACKTSKGDIAEKLVADGLALASIAAVQTLFNLAGNQVHNPILSFGSRSRGVGVCG